MDKSVIIRLVVMLVTIANVVLSLFGCNPLPFSEAETYAILSAGAMAGATIWAAWKNNSVTKAAKLGDKIVLALKNGEVTLEEINKLIDNITHEKAKE